VRVALVLIAVLLGVACAYTTQQWREVKTRVDVAERTASMYQDSYDYQCGETEELRQKLQLAIDGLRTSVDKYTELQSQYEQQVKAAQDARFEFYYSPAVIHRESLDELKGYLELFDWVRQLYSEGYFDCSETAAYMEWSLENAGFHTVVMCGDSPSGGGKHAWLLVETDENRYMPVEATVPCIVWWEDKHFDDYFHGDYQFQDITEAIAAGYSEFDWWMNWEP